MLNKYPLNELEGRKEGREEGRKEGRKEGGREEGKERKKELGMIHRYAKKKKEKKYQTSSMRHRFYKV